MSGMASISIPESHLSWNLYGQGFENLGLAGKPERVPTPHPGPDQILARIDSVGICYSDVKLINQGNQHLKIAGRDLANQPTRPGHEVSFTVAAVGTSLEEDFQVGDRFAIQPEVVLNQQRQTYGFSLPGGLTQYQLIGPELLNTDTGPSILKLDPAFGYSEAALLEPWGSVLSSYSTNRRLTPKPGGWMWVIGNPANPLRYDFSKYSDLPETILITGIPHDLENMIRAGGSQVERWDGITVNNYDGFVEDRTRGHGIDDIILLDPHSSQLVSKTIKLVNPGGLVNLVGSTRLDKKICLDPRRIHYQFVALVGNSGADIAASYGEERNRSDLLEGGTVLFIGGGGPMGQIHIQRALRMQHGPARIVITEIDQQRTAVLERAFASDLQKTDKEVIVINPISQGPGLAERIRQITGRSVVDDLVVLVPSTKALKQAAELVQEDSLLNLFAGTPGNVNLILDLSSVYLGNLQITGATGLEFQHIQEAYGLALQGKIDLNFSVAAVGGMTSALDAIKAAAGRRVPGKIIIYPQLENLSLMSLRELEAAHPTLKPFLDNGIHWSREAEKTLLNLVAD